MAGPGLERVWNGMERGLERNRPLQHSTATTQVVSTSLPDWEFGASASLAGITQHSCATAGADLHAQEGHKQSILRNLSGSSQAHTAQLCHSGQP